MGRKLTAAQINQYDRDGFVYPVDAFGSEHGLWLGFEFTGGHDEV